MAAHVADCAAHGNQTCHRRGDSSRTEEIGKTRDLRDLGFYLEQNYRNLRDSSEGAHARPNLLSLSRMEEMGTKAFAIASNADQ